MLAVPPIASLVLRAMNASWRIREAGDIKLSPHANPQEPKIYAVWHEIALAASFYHDKPIHALASQSFDGELISRTLHALGYRETARGSSSRGGLAGMLRLQRGIENGGHALITCDGPRGPRHIAKLGAIHLARLSGVALVPAHFACSSGIRLRSWDHMQIPAPFARGVFWFGEELRFSREGESDEAAMGRLQKGLEKATQDALDFIRPRAL